MYAYTDSVFFWFSNYLCYTDTPLFDKTAQKIATSYSLLRTRVAPDVLPSFIKLQISTRSLICSGQFEPIMKRNFKKAIENLTNVSRRHIWLKQTHQILSHYPADLSQKAQSVDYGMGGKVRFHYPSIRSWRFQQTSAFILYWHCGEFVCSGNIMA